MTDPLRLLGANIRVAANLTLHDAHTAHIDANQQILDRLRLRASVVGMELNRCYIDPDCDGSCGCDPGLRAISTMPGEGPLIEVGDLITLEGIIEERELHPQRPGPP